jgi:hypothetical protein
MGILRRGGRDLAIVAVIVAALVAVLTGAVGSASDPKAARDGFASQRFAFSGSLPSGWNRSARRLVPLLMPREVLSVGTAPMPVGGGGNCGREPVAAIARMRPGDVLLSIQEYVVTRRMRCSSRPPLLVSHAAVPRSRPRVRRTHLPRGTAVGRSSRAAHLDPRSTEVPAGCLPRSPRLRSRQKGDRVVRC